MLELAILACLATNPGTCTTRTIDATEMGLHGCLVASMRQAALLQALELGPNWRIVKVRCGRRQFEKEA